jgi:hypothetical protein
MAHAHPEPFEGIEGYWVHRSQFSGTKSFGWYQCDAATRLGFPLTPLRNTVKAVKPVRPKRYRAVSG